VSGRSIPCDRKVPSGVQSQTILYMGTTSLFTEYWLYFYQNGIWLDVQYSKLPSLLILAVTSPPFIMHNPPRRLQSCSPSQEPSSFSLASSNCTTAPERSSRAVTKYWFGDSDSLCRNHAIFHPYDRVPSWISSYYSWTFLWYGTVYDWLAEHVHHGRRKQYAWRHSHSQRDI
jgi:hypothetical protein